MLVKRLLLLPGKGDVIICIFILLNVLSGKPVSSVKVSSVGGSWTSTTSSSTSYFSHLSFAIPSIYYSSVSLVLATKFHLISLQFPTSNAEAVLLSQGPPQKPVMNKTEPLLMAEISRGRKASSHQHKDSNYNKRRRTPFYNRSSSAKARSSSTLNNIFNYASVNVSLSGTVSDSSRKLIVGKSTFSKLRGSSSTSSSSELRNVTKVSKSRENKKPSGVRLKLRRRKGRTRQLNPNPTPTTQSSSGAKKRTRQPKLLKEITLFNRQNCLAKLLCGVQVAQPPTKSSSALNDYAYLVKAFFDRFSIRGIVTDAIDSAFAYEQDTLDVLDDEADEEDEEDDTSSERRKKKRTKGAGFGGAAAHKPRTPAFEKYKPKYYDEYDKDVEDMDLEELVDDDIPEFMQPDLFRRRVGRNMTHVKPFKPPLECKEGPNRNVTTRKGGKLRRKRSRNVPVDIDRIRRKRGIVGNVKRGFMGFFNPRFDKTAYLDKRQLELETSKSQARQFNIAEEIAARIRSPRQCRLLNWFGNTNSNTNQNANNPNGMTTTITTITNTGGMIGNLERLNGMTNLPQAAVSGNGASGPGSQVVTVIQQSPLGAQNAAANPTAATSSMLNNMGQTASNAMAQASDVASSMCPFNIQELQELILKAQNAPFPHFLTTTPPPNRIVPANVYQPVVQAASQPASTSTTATSTTLKATQAPPPHSSTVAVVVNNPTGSRRDPSAFVHLYGDFASVPTPPSSHYHYNRYPNSPTEIYPSPLYPSPTYPTTFFSPPQDSKSRVQQQTRLPSIIPAVGTAGEDDEGDFDDDPYVVYEKYTDNRKNLHSLRKKAKPTPKWMTTTTPASNDDFYSYNDAIPNYSYGTKQEHSTYKVSHSPQKQKPIQTTQKTVTNAIRQFHQPPEVFDSKKRYPPGSFHQVKLNSRKKFGMQPGNAIKPKLQQTKKGSSASEENSDEDTSGNSDSNGDENEEDDEEEGSDEETSSTSGSGERSNLNMKPQPLPNKPQSTAASEEEDGSNEAEEQSESNNENEEEEDGESEEEDDNDGKRSYERNDFSKDRGGPPDTHASSSVTAKPFRDTNTITDNDSSNSPGFFSNFIGSLSSFGSFFNRKDKTVKNSEINKLLQSKNGALRLLNK